jgi:DNA-binding transcriptional ArsR family regulator
MDTYETQAQLYKILMHPTRLAILDELRDGEQCVCHMEAKFGLRQAYISQHLMVMRDAGLVTDRRDGWNVFYRVIKPEIYQVIDAMSALFQNENRSQLRNKPSNAKSNVKRRACPCPKCNSGAESPRLESHDVVMDEMKGSV